ncbi:hypothetical protein F2Q70_00000135 [Brassica cretica]|uniref:Uncharacterized protein n=1 Tax=Brassica cretica TaxID=69181 RepID=A0A8S9IT02_BRACR|nr:hypothetical protein F2Q70_00000135 [Brassica cretica]
MEHRSSLDSELVSTAVTGSPLQIESVSTGKDSILMKADTCSEEKIFLRFFLIPPNLLTMDLLEAAAALLCF